MHSQTVWRHGAAMATTKFEWQYFVNNGHYVCSARMRDISENTIFTIKKQHLLKGFFRAKFDMSSFLFKKGMGCCLQ